MAPRQAPRSLVDDRNLVATAGRIMTLAGVAPLNHEARGRGRHASRTAHRVAASRSAESRGLGSGGATKMNEDEGPRAETGREAEARSGRNPGRVDEGQQARFY